MSIEEKALQFAHQLNDFQGKSCFLGHDKDGNIYHTFEVINNFEYKWEPCNYDKYGELDLPNPREDNYIVDNLLTLLL